jgi:hypothetical protein
LLAVLLFCLIACSFLGLFSFKINLNFPCQLSFACLNKLRFQVQIQLQLTIEAQGRYLQMIIEEQQKLGGSIKASEDQKLSDSPPSLDDYPEIMQPSPKKPRIDALSPDSERDTTQPEFESHLIGPWDHGIAFPLEEFKADPAMSKS